ncbi:MAG: hypothetical protein ACREGR_03865, partial [Minisyncoccia bacterium]
PGIEDVSVDLIAELRAAVEAEANVRNLDVIDRLISMPLGRKAQCPYQKIWQRLRIEKLRVGQCYEGLLRGVISHALIEDYWEDRRMLCKLVRHLAYKRPCGTCVMCKFVNPREV